MSDAIAFVVSVIALVVSMRALAVASRGLGQTIWGVCVVVSAGQASFSLLVAVLGVHSAFLWYFPVWVVVSAACLARTSRPTAALVLPVAAAIGALAFFALQAMFLELPLFLASADTDPVMAVPLVAVLTVEGLVLRRLSARRLGSPDPHE